LGGYVASQSDHDSKGGDQKDFLARCNHTCGFHNWFLDNYKTNLPRV
jgi:hypothetical protein